METRSSYVLVGAVALALLVGLFAFILYIARFSGEDKREFDIFFDNAITGLAVGSPAAFDCLIGELRDALGLTVFLITHDLDTLYAICDRVAVLADRKVVAIGTIPELLALDHEWIQAYFKGPRGRAADSAVAKRVEADA